MTEQGQAFLTFRVGTTWLAVATPFVDSVIDMLPMTPVPRVPPHIRGLVAYRGQAVPALDVSSFLALPAASAVGPAEERDRLVVLSIGSTLVAVMCQSVQGIGEYDADALTEPKLVQGARLREFTRLEIQQGERVTAVLDAEALLEAARAI
jgi:purine-binding chemotaxis protein CheW